MPYGPAAPPNRTSQLSLFDEPPLVPSRVQAVIAPAPAPMPAHAPAVAPAHGPEPAPASAPAPAPAPAPASAPASAPSAPAIAAPLRSEPATDAATAEFRHPAAQRELLLRGHLVAYALRRSRRRSIGFAIGADGLSVSAPRWVSVAEIEAALRDKAAWILRKLQEQRERASRVAQNKVDWRDGTTIPFLGEPVTVRLCPRSTGAVLHTADGQRAPGNTRHALHLGLPSTATPAQMRDAVQSWLQRQARRIFEERCALLAPPLGVRVKRLSLSSAATRWGSASADGSIRLNWRLVHFAMPVIDYVVTHELAHLREMNHSPAFWDVVRTAMPDYETARGTLRQQVLPAFE